jgi:hypothetical protein
MVPESARARGGGEYHPHAMTEAGKNKIKALAERIRQKQQVTDEQRNRKGLLLIELVARELSQEGGVPELRVTRDAVSKLHVNRGEKVGEIALEWQRPIGATVMTFERPGVPRRTWKYILDEPADVWRRMEGEGELWEDLASGLEEYLYPDHKL